MVKIGTDSKYQLRNRDLKANDKITLPIPSSIFSNSIGKMSSERQNHQDHENVFSASRYHSYQDESSSSADYGNDESSAKGFNPTFHTS